MNAMALLMESADRKSPLRRFLRRARGYRWNVEAMVEVWHWNQLLRNARGWPRP